MAELLNETFDNDEDAMKNKFLTFLIGKEVFGIEIRRVMEIVGIQPVTVIPETSDYIKGVINLRGQIISVIDVRLRFKRPPLEYGDRTCIIVIEVKGMSLGLIVDSVSEVLTIMEEDIIEKPEIGANETGGYIQNIGKMDGQVILLIDCEKLVYGEVPEAAPTW